MICWALLFHFRSCEGVCDTPLHLFDWIPVDVGLCVGFIFARMRAYAIRPYTCSIEFLAMLVCVLVSFSLAWGHMRYAPTPVRLNSCRCWFVCLFLFRPYEGVCDTPLHLFDWISGDVSLCVGFIFAHMRAYAIRPYIFLLWHWACGESVTICVWWLCLYPSIIFASHTENVLLQSYPG